MSDDSANKLVIGAYFQNVTVPQPHRTRLAGAMRWMRSVVNTGYRCVLLTNNDEIESAGLFTHQKVTPNPDYPVYHNRFFAAVTWLEQHEHELQEIWVTDTPDVEMLNKPQVADKIYVGSEPHKNGTYPWILERKPAVLSVLKDYDDIVRPNTQLLNCGVIGGKTNIVLPFLREYVNLMAQLATPFADMLLINYLGYKHGVEFGPHVTTLFKAYEKTNAWFRHK